MSDGQERTQSIILNSTAEGIYGVDFDGNCTFANRACARLLGYDSPDEFQGVNMHQLMHHTRADGSHYPNEECSIYRAFRNGEEIHIVDELFWMKDGTSVPCEYWSYPMWREGELVGAVVTFVDISERIEFQESQQRLQSELQDLVSKRTADLDQTREQLELTLIGANVGMWDWNAVTNDVHYSETFMNQLGYPKGIVWDHFSDWETNLHPDDVDQALESVQRYFSREDKEYKSTFRLKCYDGSYRWILAQGKAEFDENGAPQRMTGVHVDINERVEQEEEMRQLNLALEHANEALQESNLDLQQFAYVASHDLQTPLRAISGFSQFLKSEYEGELDERADGYIDRIVAGVKRMQRMIDDLLNFSRVESRAAPFETVPLNEVFEDAVDLLEAPIADTNALVTRDDLPTIDGDKAQLAQLFTNLIGNGIKYHRGEPKIHVAADVDHESVTISFADNGIGIEEKFFERIFDVFRRLHAHDQYPGTGIGLAVCRRIAKRHHGRIWVESSEGEGATFFVSLPMQVS